jgi:hypothetical protein
MREKVSAEERVREIRRKTRKKYSAEESAHCEVATEDEAQAAIAKRREAWPELRFEEVV